MLPLFLQQTFNAIFVFFFQSQKRMIFRIKRLKMTLSHGFAKKKRHHNYIFILLEASSN